MSSPSAGNALPLHRFPDWLDRSMYPFRSRYFDSADGRMHYVDEGDGTPIVFVHGTPTWSFLFRRFVAHLSARHRVIAVDHLGFGLSDKPAHAPYEPKDHARRLVALLDALDLRGATLVVHDFGGPIGLAVAFARPERFERFVLFNTWLWPLDDDARIARGARIAGSLVGRLLYRHLNLPVRVLMPSAVADRRILTPDIVRHYASPLASPDERAATWACARALLGAGPWYDSLWAHRALLREKPTLLLWGLRDPAFGPRYLARWQRELPGAEVHTFPASGHFVPEEAGADAVSLLARFVDRPAGAPAAAR
jgi:haloalkane dehalogenase